MSKIRLLGKEKLQELLNSSSGYSNVLRKIGLKPGGSNPETLKKIIAEFNLDISGMVKNRNRVNSMNGFKEIPIEDILIENSTYGRNHLGNRLVKEGLLECKCFICNNTGEWLGKKLVLQIDHINGIRDDNRIENLRFLCPNCHTQTNTYGKKQRSVE